MTVSCSTATGTFSSVISITNLFPTITVSRLGSGNNNSNDEALYWIVFSPSTETAFFEWSVSLLDPASIRVSLAIQSTDYTFP